MTDSPPQTFYFSPEIEEATVSILWHEPERIAEFLRDFDPHVHFIGRHLRIILEAIDIAYRELGSSDFPTVLQVIRELGQFEEAGGIHGLAHVFALSEYQIPHTDQVFKNYAEMLRVYAKARQSEIAVPIRNFTAGRGNLVKNQLKRRPNDPDLIGAAQIKGRNYQVKARITAEGLNLIFDPK